MLMFHSTYSRALHSYACVSMSEWQRRCEEKRRRTSELVRIEEKINRTMKFRIKHTYVCRIHWSVWIRDFHDVYTSRNWSIFWPGITIFVPRNDHIRSNRHFLSKRFGAIEGRRANFISFFFFSAVARQPIKFNWLNLGQKLFKSVSISNANVC